MTQTPAEQTSSPPSTPEATTIDVTPRKKLTLRKAIILGLVSMGYTSTLGALGAYQVLYSPASPLLSMAVTMIMVLALVQVITYFARQHVGTGGLLTYTYDPDNPYPGYFVAIRSWSAT